MRSGLSYVSKGSSFFWHSCFISVLSSVGLYLCVTATLLAWRIFFSWMQCYTKQLNSCFFTLRTFLFKTSHLLVTTNSVAAFVLFFYFFFFFCLTFCPCWQTSQAEQLKHNTRKTFTATTQQQLPPAQS